MPAIFLSFELPRLSNLLCTLCLRPAILCGSGSQPAACVCTVASWLHLTSAAREHGCALMVYVCLLRKKAEHFEDVLFCRPSGLVRGSLQQALGLHCQIPA